MNNLVPKKANTISVVILLTGVVIGFIGVFSEISAITVIGIVVMFASILFRVVFYRCPHCGRYLDRNNGDYCPYCGKEVNK